MAGYRHFHVTTFRAYERTRPGWAEAGTVLFEQRNVGSGYHIPVLPRSTKRREGNVATLQVERSARVLGRCRKM